MIVLDFQKDKVERNFLTLTDSTTLRWKLIWETGEDILELPFRKLEREEEEDVTSLCINLYYGFDLSVCSITGNVAQHLRKMDDTLYSTDNNYVQYLRIGEHQMLSLENPWYVLGEHIIAKTYYAVERSPITTFVTQEKCLQIRPSWRKAKKRHEQYEEILQVCVDLLYLPKVLGNLVSLYAEYEIQM